MVAGRTYGQRSQGMNREVLDVSELSSGMYFVNIAIGEKQFSQKLQVQNR